MTTDRDIGESPELAPDAAVDAPRPEAQREDGTVASARASQPHDEATVRAPDAMIPARRSRHRPMRCPDDAWAMLVAAVDTIGDDDPTGAGEVALFADDWVAEQPRSTACTTATSSCA